MKKTTLILAVAPNVPSDARPKIMEKDAGAWWEKICTMATSEHRGLRRTNFPSPASFPLILGPTAESTLVLSWLSHRNFNVFWLCDYCGLLMVL